MILDLIALDDASRVWIYQADRLLSYDELDAIRERLFPFLASWVSHDRQLMTYGNVFHRRFLALFVDETRAAQASGCSIDASVRFVKALEQDFDLDFFDRMTYTYLDKDEEVAEVRHADLANLYACGDVDDTTFFFDHLVKDKGDFLKGWTKPLADSWHKRFV